MTPKLVKGYRNIPVVQYNPNWWMIEIFYCFGVHLYNLYALNHCYYNNILSVKEDGGYPMLTKKKIDYSHIMMKQCRWIHLDT